MAGQDRDFYVAAEFSRVLFFYEGLPQVLSKGSSQAAGIPAGDTAKAWRGTWDHKA